MLVEWNSEKGELREKISPKKMPTLSTTYSTPLTPRLKLETAVEVVHTLVNWDVGMAKSESYLLSSLIASNESN